MTTEFRCPECAATWFVDRQSGDELLCPTCLTRIAIDPTAEVPSAPSCGSVAGVAQATRATAAATSPTSPAPRFPTPTGAPAPVIAAAETQAEIVCPRCHLHFSPHRRRPSVKETRKTVLVVEDQTYFREFAKEALSPGFEVRTAEDSAEARRVLAGGGIDLLVLDLTLDGGGGGLQLLRELVPKPCPVLIFTAQDESELYGETWDALRRAGADDLVIKGMQASESLARKAAALLGTPMDEADPFG